jgi:hypothetical protein
MRILGVASFANSLSESVSFKFDQETRRIFQSGRSIDPEVARDLCRDPLQGKSLLQALPNARACLVGGEHSSAGDV